MLEIVHDHVAIRWIEFQPLLLDIHPINSDYSLPGVRLLILGNRLDTCCKLNLIDTFLMIIVALQDLYIFPGRDVIQCFVAGYFFLLLFTDAFSEIGGIQSLEGNLHLG